MRRSYKFNVSRNIRTVCKIGCWGVNDEKNLPVVGLRKFLNRFVEVSTSRLLLDLNNIPVTGNRFAKLKIVSSCMLPEDAYP